MISDISVHSHLVPLLRTEVRPNIMAGGEGGGKLLSSWYPGRGERERRGGEGETEGGGGEGKGKEGGEREGGVRGRYSPQGLTYFIQPCPHLPAVPTSSQ